MEKGLAARMDKVLELCGLTGRKAVRWEGWRRRTRPGCVWPGRCSTTRKPW